MPKMISIDPGKSKCGLVLVDINKKTVDQAIVINTEFLPKYVRTLKNLENGKESSVKIEDLSNEIKNIS